MSLKESQLISYTFVRLLTRGPYVKRLDRKLA